VIALRPARDDEAARLSEIALAAKRHWGYREAWIDFWRAELTVQPAQVRAGGYTVALDGGSLAGFSAISLAGRLAQLDHLWVLPAHMRRGCGTALLRHALERCARDGFPALRVTADPNALEFYRAAGGRVVGTQPSVPAPRELPVVEFDLAARNGIMPACAKRNRRKSASRTTPRRRFS
jgi:ribosomal protein S18 acetylase RimI-like enzyme